MFKLLDSIKVRNPKLAEEIEWKLADAQARAQASAEFRRSSLEQKINADLGR